MSACGHSRPSEPLFTDRPQPVLCADDKGIMPFRRWSKQFL